MRSAPGGQRRGLGTAVARLNPVAGPDQVRAHRNAHPAESSQSYPGHRVRPMHHPACSRRAAAGGTHHIPPAGRAGPRLLPAALCPMRDGTLRTAGDRNCVWRRPGRVAGADVQRSGRGRMSSDAIVVLKADHKEIRALFRKFQAAGDKAVKTKEKIAGQIIELLTVHAYIENEVMYPEVCALLPNLKDDVLESYEEHHVADVLCMELAGMPAGAERFDAKASVMFF